MKSGRGRFHNFQAMTTAPSSMTNPAAIVNAVKVRLRQAMIPAAASTTGQSTTPLPGLSIQIVHANENGASRANVLTASGSQESPPRRSRPRATKTSSAVRTMSAVNPPIIVRSNRRW